MSTEQKRKLEQQLWSVADTLRGKMSADEFKDYMLGFIFYKYLSEKMESHADRILEGDGIAYKDIDADTENGRAMLEAVREDAVLHLGYFLKPSELFRAVARKGKGRGDGKEEDAAATFILDDLTRILNSIEQSTMGSDSEDDFNKLFEDLDLRSTKLGRTEEAKNKVIAQILGKLDAVDFQLNDIEADVLGDAYEYLIGKFASGAGKKAGEFYTPQQVSKILAKVVTTGKQRLRSVYDPTCGSGSLLLRVAREVAEVGMFHGQELNRTTYNLARMNMLLHDVHYNCFDIRQEDTLEHPQHPDLRAEAIVANPPFSAEWSASPIHLSDDRFSQYGRLAPASKADFAFVQHMLHHLAENGIMAVVVPHGVLFRGGAEGHIRQYLVENKNYLDAVIGLPGSIFYGTTIPTAILVFKKCREHPDDILFIDASRHFEKVKTQNRLRDEDVEKIISTYRQRLAEEKYSHRASLDQVRGNEYNLNIPRYVDTFDEEQAIDIHAVAARLQALETEMADTNAAIAGYCQQLDIATPF